jgi:hypothetical protein
MNETQVKNKLMAGLSTAMKLIEKGEYRKAEDAIIDVRMQISAVLQVADMLK